MTLISPEIIRIDPDVFLQTPTGRVWSPERGKEAWLRSYDALKEALAAAERRGQRRRVIIVCGLQGAGKSSWIKLHGYRYSPCIFFDAALPGARHRRNISHIAKQFDAELWVVWIKTSLAIALERNAIRATDERVPEEAIRSVAEIFEPPTMDEGFDKIIMVD